MNTKRCDRFIRFRHFGQKAPDCPRNRITPVRKTEKQQIKFRKIGRSRKLGEDSFCLFSNHPGQDNPHKWLCSDLLRRWDKSEDLSLFRSNARQASPVRALSGWLKSFHQCRKDGSFLGMCCHTKKNTRRLPSSLWLEPKQTANKTLKAKVRDFF